jgi:hypothetical protein
MPRLSQLSQLAFALLLLFCSLLFAFFYITKYITKYRSPKNCKWLLLLLLLFMSGNQGKREREQGRQGRQGKQSKRSGDLVNSRDLELENFKH